MRVEPKTETYRDAPPLPAPKPGQHQEGASWEGGEGCGRWRCTVCYGDSERGADDE